ncbi:protein kinase [Rhodococcus sp. IEGM 1379]|uniref:protein kinase domain-containing protein n=1 Tax=Rhodococcus sp. IEGM 1379 TaxID=3047086 RepID=UPI0024B73942|nr:protein kinase [Rhodococcus sp. IEGM 1379]MDI9914777.1 protein kinase [Rhodococcus sp. IEGM 1379]
MTDVDPFATRRNTTRSGRSVAAELAASGFEDAQEIGRGGFGVVYRCTQPSLDRTVAVKVLTADLDEENRARFLREQQAAGRLTGHPNIVTVLHAGVTDNGRPFTVMPYYSQDSLDARIRHHGPLPLNEALRLGIKIADALEFAHRHGVLHRDVKPGNILLTDYGEPALSDFGIAHVPGGFETGTGIVTGSPAFIAPEIVVGEPPSSAADVYGLGATLFTVITGHAAFERRSGEQLVAQFLRITSEPVPDPRRYGIAEDIGVIIEGAMSANPGNRPSAEELGRQIRESQRRHGFHVDEPALNVDPSLPADTPLVVANAFSEGAVSSGRRETGTSVASDRTSGLPLELTSFVGRRTELVEAENLLSTSRLVTLTGIGGVGKTRLAVRVATKRQHLYADGARLVELGELYDATLLVDVVAGALGLRDRSARPVQVVVTDFLASRELLMVLDNCEQLLDGVAQLAERLLRFCPGVTILATSREPIGIAGEAVLLVPPLPVPDPDHLSRGAFRNDSMRLFLDRGGVAVPGFALVEDNKVAIARICRKGRLLADQATAALMRAHIDQAEGTLALFTGNFVDACSHLEDAAIVFAEQEDLLFEVVAVTALGMARELLNETDRAIECYERALVITEARGEAAYRGYALWALALAVWRQDDRVRAVRLLEQALELGRRVNDRLHASMCLQTLAWIDFDEKDARRAAVLMGASEEVSKSLGSSTVVLPGLSVYQEACEAETRRLLGPQAFAAAQKKGRALGFHGAVAYALGEQDLPTGTSSASPSVTPTKRELEVAGLIADGMTNKEIAARLVISPRTAQGHVEHLLVKLGFTSRAQIAAWFVESRRNISEH